MKAGNFSARRKTHDTSDYGTNHKLQQNVTDYAPNNSLKSPGGQDMLLNVMQSPDKRTMGRNTSKGMITSEANGRSITNFASSLRDDDLMISSSQVDPMEGRSMRTTSKLGATEKMTKSKPMGLAGQNNMASMEQLAILEESSSLRSVSPLTENSQSKKSSLIQGSPAKFVQI